MDPETGLDGVRHVGSIPHVLVNGTFVVRDGKTVPDAYPGRPVMGKYRN